MKRIAILTFLMLAAVTLAFSQASRVDQQLLTSGPNVPTAGGALAQALWVSNSTVYVCTHPSASLAACQASPIITYTDSTEATACPSTAQMTQLPGTSCTNSSGVTANVGFWYAGGIVDYWITSSYGSYGPFSVNAGTGGGSPSVIYPTGVINGVNQTFTFTQNYTATPGLVYEAGVLQQLTTDYTLTYSSLNTWTLTFTLPPLNGPIQVLWFLGAGGGGGGGSMTWPAAAGIPCYSGISSWCTSYSSGNPVPAGYGGTGVNSITGVIKGNGTGAFSQAGYADIIALWTNGGTCNFSTTLYGDGHCAASGGGNVSNSGTPSANQYAKWVTATTIQGQTGVPWTDLTSIPSTWPGNANTATALAGSPSQCGSGLFPTGIASNGNAAGCTSPSGSGSKAQYTSVSYSSTPTFTSTSNTVSAFTITLTGNVSSSTLAAAYTGQYLSFQICEDATGGRTFVWPTGFSNAVTIFPAASTCTLEEFFWDGTNAQPVAPAQVTGSTLNALWYGSTGTAPATPPSGFLAAWFDSTDNALKVINSSGTVSAAIVPGTCASGAMAAIADNAAPTCSTTLLATGIVDGKAPVTVTTAATATLGGTYKSGYTFNQEATAATAITYTLPTAAAGLQYCVANSYNGSAANTGTVEILTSASGQFIIGTSGTLSATGGYIISGGAARDSACVVGVDATHWMFYPSSGTWTLH